MITHIFVSDLHLGADNSLLSNMTDGGLAPGTPSPVMQAFGDALASLTVDQHDKPQLVLGGDVFELALSPTHLALDTFGDFARMLFDQNVFASNLAYVAGNHDHHLWELARQSQYAEFISATDPEIPLRNDWHVTHLLPDHDVLPHDDVLITTVARRACPDADITVRHSYPNFGIVGEQAAIVYHHGHYTESIYRAVEWLHEIFMPSRPSAEAAWHIEADNYAWVDFMWSTLGRSGDAGGDVAALYEMLQSEEAIETVVDRLIDIGVVGDHPTLRRRLAAWLLRRGAGLAVREGARLERHRSNSPLSADAERGLHEYLRVAVATQLADEVARHDMPLTFVFGHTHKPFAERLEIDGFSRPVDVFNTGGWVIDTRETSPLQGASAILGDAMGRVVAIEIYRQDNAHSLSVTALAPEATEFAAEIERRIDADRSTWDALEATITTEIAARHRQLGQRIVADIGRVHGEPPRTGGSS